MVVATMLTSFLMIEGRITGPFFSKIKLLVAETLESETSIGSVVAKYISRANFGRSAESTSNRKVNFSLRDFRSSLNSGVAVGWISPVSMTILSTHPYADH